MNGALSVDYSADFFRITQNDLDRIARRIEQTGLARNLTDLGRRFVHGRLHYGPERESPLPLTVLPRDRVRIWDPEAAWHAGDPAIIAEPGYRDRVRTYLPTIGQVVKVQDHSVTIRVDGAGALRVYGLAGRDQRNASLDAWRASIEVTVAALQQRGDEMSRVDYLLWVRGEEIWSELLGALRHDPRFVVLDGEWFLRSMVVKPSTSAMENLARQMLQTTGPLNVTELLPWCGAARSAGIPGRFGVALALQERPDLFRNVDTAPNPRWVLAGPPPGPYTARHAAYDPDSYELLCEPGELLSQETVERLWALDLLSAVV